MNYKKWLIKTNIIRLRLQNYIICNPISAMLFKSIAIHGYGSDRCLKNGYLPVPVHFYSPIPDIKYLERRDTWNRRSNLAGINFNEVGQLELLEELGRSFGNECDWPLVPTENDNDFSLDNNCFSYGCAASLHTIIRKYKPNRIMEIGSGYSSKIITKALELNRKDSEKNCEYVVIDPYPHKLIASKSLKYDKLIKRRVEEVSPGFFQNLAENDILFIDSSHSVKIGGDVNHLYLEVLPLLRSGVIVHIHDIELPYEYPKKYAKNEAFRQFWTEQYLLQAFLVNNDKFEIILGMAYIMKDHSYKFSKAFLKYAPEKHKLISCSFWMRRK